jgi:hypothetical protein
MWIAQRRSPKIIYRSGKHKHYEHNILLLQPCRPLQQGGGACHAALQGVTGPVADARCTVSRAPHRQAISAAM